MTEQQQHHEDYLEYLGLKEPPFALTPDPHFLFPTEENQKALQGIFGCVKRGEGYAVLTGDIGTGKTMICRALLGLFEQEGYETALLVNPFISEAELLRALLTDFGVHPRTDSEIRAPGAGSTDVQRMVEEITDFLARNAKEGKRCVALVDEAQNLPISALEQLRILGNLEKNKEKLLQIVLVGQNEFLDTLKNPRLMQLVQRISNWFRLGPLPQQCVAEYFRFRLEQAGLQKGLDIGKNATVLATKLTRGYPRLMNILFDRALREVCWHRKWGIEESDIQRASKGMPSVQSVAGGSTPGSGQSKGGHSVKLGVAVLLMLVAGIAGFMLNKLIGNGETITTPPPQVQPKTGPWTLVIGQFDVKEDASESVGRALSILKESPERQLCQGYIAEAQQDGATFYMALIGSFTDNEQAAAARQSVLQTFPDCRIVESKSLGPSRESDNE